jgi:hypothetical protein
MTHTTSRRVPRSGLLSRLARRGAGALLAVAALAALGTASSQQPAPPVRVTVEDEKAVIRDPDASVPVEPGRGIQYTPSGLSVAIRTERNETLHLSHFPTLNIDGKLYQYGQGGRPEVNNRPLPAGKGRQREGFQSIYHFGDVQVTATFTLVPSKPPAPGAKRRLDTILIHYLLENKGKQTRKIGLRVYMDTYVVTNDGCQFAAPTMPGKILNGVELKGKTLPDYVQLLQVPNLKAPGYVAHLTLSLGSRIEKAERVVLTQHGTGFNTWDMPAIAAGDTGLGVFWEPKEIKPGAKREIAYGYGRGIASSPESEGLVNLTLGGSFEPGKRFTVAARVADPAPGQSLRLELPLGMELLEGPQVQPVPGPANDEGTSLVMWTARVQRPGAFTVRVHSSTGVTQGKIVTIKR